MDFTKNQLRELLTNYGEIPFLIIDGWHAKWGGPRYEKMDYDDMEHFIKSLQPNCLILNHSCENNLDHTDIVFFENAAGQEVPPSFNGPGMGGNILTDHWFWKSTDPHSELKSADWALEKIIEFNVKLLLQVMFKTQFVVSLAHLIFTDRKKAQANLKLNSLMKICVRLRRQFRKTLTLMCLI